MIIIRKTVIILFLSGFAMWLIFFCWVHISYASNLPEAPDENARRVYRMVVNHGFVRYGTEQDIRILRWAQNSQMIAVACLLIAIVLRLRYDDFKRGSPEDLNKHE